MVELTRRMETKSTNTHGRGNVFPMTSKTQSPMIQPPIDGKQEIKLTPSHQFGPVLLLNFLYSHTQFLRGWKYCQRIPRDKQWVQTRPTAFVDV